MKKLLLSLTISSVVLISAVGATRSFFSDTETSTSNQLVAGRLDLKVNGEDDPETVVDLSDLKPGDDRIVEKRLFVDFNPAKIYLHLKDLVPGQGEQTEPETVEETALGGPKFNIQDYIDYDLIDSSGNAVIDVEDNISLPDAVSCWIPLGTIPGNQEVTIQQSFHFDAGVTNWAQGDTLSFTEEFLAMQITDPTVPTTGTGRVWNPDTKRCESQISCVTTYANSASSVNQGLRKNGTAVLPDRSNTSFMFGIPQSSGSGFESPVVASSFFSLGFKTAPPDPDGGSVVLGFDAPFYDQPGPDLQVYEVTGGPPYPDEKVRVEVSNLASGPWTVVSASLTKDGTVDINPVSSAQFVRLTDVSDINLFEATADGYDVDAVKALCGTETEQ